MIPKPIKDIPLFIGIAGHRDIADEYKPTLQKLITSILEEKKRQCPHTRIIVLTPLAEGADRVAAYSAMESGLAYIAIVPMPLEVYRREFKDKESLKEFDDLLSKAESIYELTVPESSYTNEEEIYYNLGFFIARQSHLLIALWDGIVNNKKGGTADIVSLKIKGLPANHPYFRYRLRNIYTGPVYHILTPRSVQAEPKDVFKSKIIYGNNSAKKGARNDAQLLSNLDTFNLDLKKLKDPEDTFSGDFIGLHAIIDKLADYYQRRRFFALKVLLILAVVAFVFFQIYVEFWSNPFILLLYPLTIGIGAIWFMRANRLRYEQKHEDYRALSEALRVQHFLSITDTKANVSDYYLQKHIGELEWITYVLRAANFLYSGKDKTAGNSLTGDLNSYNYVNDHWVKDQEKYYRQKGEIYDRRLRNIRFLANGLFVAAVLSSLILFSMNILNAHSHSGTMHSLLILLTHSFMVISATLFGYNEKMIFEEQSKTYHQMFNLFHVAGLELTHAIEQKNTTEASEIIKELGFDSLMENADWLLLHRSRPMEIPKG